MANANDPIKRKELYDFLKQNDLVKTDFDTFSAKYAEGDTGQLHSFLKDNNLTTKSQEDFDADYFGDLKKKEDSEPIGQETEEESPIVEETQKDGSSGTVISKRNTINQEIASLNKSYKDANDKSQEAYEAYKEKFDLLSKNWDDQPRQEKSLDFIREEEAKEDSKKAPKGINRTADVQLDGNESPSTVLMSSHGDYIPPDANGKYVAFPTIFPKDPNNQTSDSKDWIVTKNDDQA